MLDPVKIIGSRDGDAPQDMRLAFMRDMRLLYPDGPHSAHQHRDVIRIYSMGWVSKMLASRDRDGLARFFKEYQRIVDLNWWPDVFWVWWGNGSELKYKP